MKVGSLGLGLGAEKKPVSDFASLTPALLLAFVVNADDAIGFDDVEEPTAGFFAGGAAFELVAGSLRFLTLAFGSMTIQ